MVAAESQQPKGRRQPKKEAAPEQEQIKMRLPEFTAENSLYRTTAYQSCPPDWAGRRSASAYAQITWLPGGAPRDCLPHCFGPCQPDTDSFQGGWQSCIAGGCNLYSAPCKPCCSVESDCINCDDCDTNPARDCPPAYSRLVCHRCVALKIEGKCNPRC